MAVLTVRKVPDDVHEILRLRAVKNGRSTEAEVRAILTEVAKPEGRIRAGSAMHAIARHCKVTDEDVKALRAVRETRPAEPVRFE